MSINPYQSPEDEPTPSTRHVEAYGTRRYRVLVALGGFCLRLYNVYFFCFFAFFSIALWWQLLSGQRGLPLPRYVELGVGVVMVP
jgi:hypothetical protein